MAFRLSATGHIDIYFCVFPSKGNTPWWDQFDKYYIYLVSDITAIFWVILPWHLRRQLKIVTLVWLLFLIIDGFYKTAHYGYKTIVQLFCNISL